MNDDYDLIFTKQNDFQLITFSIIAQDFLQFVHFKSREEDPIEGVQRSFDSTRSKKIGNAIIEEDLVMPNSIIVNLDLKGTKIKYNDIVNDKLKKIDLKLAKQLIEKQGNKIEDLFFVIDGQHRLRAFGNDGVPPFQIIVTAYIDLSIADIANTFVQINYNQKSVNKSLVYDLLGITEKVFPEYMMLHSIVERLNSDVDSPFYGEIKMLGNGQGLISQASIISAIEKYKVINRLYGIGINSNEDILFSVIKLYFNSIEKLYADNWKNRSTLLTKSIGLRVLIKFLPDLVNYIGEKNIKFEMENILEIFQNIDKKILEISKMNKMYKTIWDYFNKLGVGGESGISNIYKLLVYALEDIENETNS